MPITRVHLELSWQYANNCYLFICTTFFVMKYNQQIISSRFFVWLCKFVTCSHDFFFSLFCLFFHRRCMKTICAKLSVRVKVPCLIRLLLPPMASENGYLGHYSSRLEVLGGHSIDCSHMSALVYAGWGWVHLSASAHAQHDTISIICYERLFMIGWHQRV